jgi:SHS2 domain-containing protein
MKFKFLEHTADIKFKAYGKSLKEAFENSALAVISSIYSEKIEDNKKKIISIKGRDLKNLLYNFLEEFLFLIDSENFLASNVRILKFDRNNLKIKAYIAGDKSSKYQIESIKAVTYNDMKINRDTKNKKWVVQVVVDA